MVWSRIYLCLSAVISASSAIDIYLEERFDESWTTKWQTPDTTERLRLGGWGLGAARRYGHLPPRWGLQTKQDSRSYALWRPFEVFSNPGRSLLFQFTVKHEQELQCGGAYMKLLSPDSQVAQLGKDTPYRIMFGPDVCGSSNRVHVINADASGQVFPLRQPKPGPVDHLTHVYTLALYPNNTFKVKIDNELVQSGDLQAELDLPPALIEDPSVSKPEDWDDRPLIDDPSVTRPADWQDRILDPAAEQPGDWDKAASGAWSAPLIPNPRGIWTPGRIDNPDYKGPWKAPLMRNPDFRERMDLYQHRLGFAAFELQQDQSGTIFDDILICLDCEEYARQQAEDGWGRIREYEAAEKAQKQQAQASAKAQTTSEQAEQVQPRGWGQQRQLRYFDYDPDDFSHPDDRPPGFQHQRHPDAEAWQPPDYWYYVYHTDDFSSPDHTEFPDSGADRRDEL